MFKKLAVSLFMLLFVFVGVAYSEGNFKNFNSDLVNALDYKPGVAKKGFKTYNKKNNIVVAVAPEKGWIVEGFVIVTGRTDYNDTIQGLRILYAYLQGTKQMFFPSKEGELICSGGVDFWAGRVHELATKATRGLVHADEVEFEFDGLKAKAIDGGKIKFNASPASDNQVLTIKLWIR